MTTIAEVRQSIADAITTGTGLRMMPYLKDNLPAPCGVVEPLEYDPRMVLGKASVEFGYVVRVFAGRVAEEQSQKRLDRLREPEGDGSLVAAVEDTDAHSATVQYVTVTRVGRQGEMSIGDVAYLYCDFDLEVVV